MRVSFLGLPCFLFSIRRLMFASTSSENRFVPLTCPSLQRLTDQLTVTRRCVTSHESLVAHRPFIVKTPQCLETCRYPPNSADFQLKDSTHSWTRDRLLDHRSCGHESESTPHIGHTPTSSRVALLDWTDSGLPKASPFWPPTDSQTGATDPTTASSIAPMCQLLRRAAGSGARDSSSSRISTPLRRIAL